MTARNPQASGASPQPIPADERELLLRHRLGDAADIVTARTWDDTSRLIGETDDSDNTTGYAYDALNRMVSKTYQDQTVGSYTYGYVAVRATISQGQDRCFWLQPSLCCQRSIERDNHILCADRSTTASTLNARRN